MINISKTAKMTYTGTRDGLKFSIIIFFMLTLFWAALLGNKMPYKFDMT